MEGAVRRNLGAQAINENGAVGHRSVEGPDTDNPVNLRRTRGLNMRRGLAAIQAALHEEAFAAAWGTGKKMSLDEAVAFALGPSK